MLPLTKLPPFFPGQWGIPGSDSPLGMRIHPDAVVFYVDNSNVSANAANDGTDPLFPLTTIALAVGKAVANRGDMIIVAEGHAENIATAGALTVNKNDVTIVGVGRGTVRPTLTVTAVGGSIIISAPNVRFENFLFTCSAAATIIVDVNSTDFSLVNCEFREGAARWVTAIDINGGGANACDRTKIIGCSFKSLTAGATQAVEIGAVADSVQIVSNWIVGDFSVGCVHSGSVCTNMLIANNWMINNNADDFCIELTAAATGLCLDNRLYADKLATILDPGSLKCMGNLCSVAVDTPGQSLPFSSGLGTIIERPTSAVPQSGPLTIFTVVGRVRLISIIGTVTANIGAFANDTKLVFGATDLCAVTTINNAQVGTRMSITGTVANALVLSTILVPAAAQAAAWTLPAGNLIMNCAGNDGGAGRVQWTMIYEPLTNGSYVIAA